ncbi:hypothetical protein OPT61_g7295 [Boeremia exigua]|uniref:Uncharacterized protein n=1 Tax=Boeremia exigua TaxID=749465 RepID=A0ACC2I3B3_9PLEO|nr:hypothetical protein OPT61_g7295 [Boeremia exigua]
MGPTPAQNYLPAARLSTDLDKPTNPTDDPKVRFTTEFDATPAPASIATPRPLRTRLLTCPPLSNVPAHAMPAIVTAYTISRDSRHKRSASGAKRAYYRKKRAFEKGRQPANTRIGAKRVHLVRTRGGNRKFRALRLDAGNFSWGSEGIAKKTRVIGVVYHPSNNELVRTNTLTRSAVVQIDAAPFRQWYEAHYGASLGRRRQAKSGEKAEDIKKSNAVSKKQTERLSGSGKVDPAVEKQFEAGRLYAVVASRPGQSGRCDGYVLEGEELAFYQRLLRKYHESMNLDFNVTWSLVLDVFVSVATCAFRALLSKRTFRSYRWPETPTTAVGIFPWRGKGLAFVSASSADWSDIGRSRAREAHLRLTCLSAQLSTS